MPNLAHPATPVAPARPRRVRRPAMVSVGEALHATTWLVATADSEDVRRIRVAVDSDRVRRIALCEVQTEIAGLDGPAALVVGTDDWDAMRRDGHRADVPVIVLDATPTVAKAVAAMRLGAIDYLDAARLGADEFRSRLARAAVRCVAEHQVDRRLERLRRAVRRLNGARRSVSRKVDVLCHDFVDGFGNVAREVERVRLASHLRHLLGDAADLEQLLCHAMDWLLRHAGDCNIAIFLDDDRGEPELAAYMKHTVPGEDRVIDWLRRRVLPRIAKDKGDDAIWSATPEELLPSIDPLDADLAPLVDHNVIATSTTYLAESLGTFVLFRRDDKPLDERSREALALAAEAFGAALTTVIRREEADATDGDQGDVGDEGDDEADWWRSGGEAPF